MVPKLPKTALPETGEYQGKPIAIKDAIATLSEAELAEVVVDVPGQGRIRPWRFVQPSSEPHLDDQGRVIIG